MANHELEGKATSWLCMGRKSVGGVKLLSSVLPLMKIGVVKLQLCREIMFLILALENFV